MDMRRSKATMYDRYPQGPMMPRGMDRCGECTDMRMPNETEDCKKERDDMRHMPLTMAYVPWQRFECTYEPVQGLHEGTIFPELNKPFYGRRGMR